ncbi:hypothetical protein MRY82_09430 [bacterium]|nr:hypothetical protein [bacterium]
MRHFTMSTLLLAMFGLTACGSMLGLQVQQELSESTDPLTSSNVPSVCNADQLMNNQASRMSIWYDGTYNSNQPPYVTLECLDLNGQIDSFDVIVEGYSSHNDSGVVTMAYIDSSECSPTGKITIHGVEDNGYVDGMAVVLSSYSNNSIQTFRTESTQDYPDVIGEHPIGMTTQQFYSQLPIDFPEDCKEEIRASLFGAAVYPNGTFQL